MASSESMSLADKGQRLGLRLIAKAGGLPGLKDKEVRAKVEAEDKSTMFLSAKDGTFDRKTNVLTLNNDISLKSSSGYEIRLNEAIVDTASGEITSNKPVEVLSQQGTITSERLEVQKSGEVVRFLGNVQMNLTPPADDAPQAAKR